MSLSAFRSVLAKAHPFNSQQPIRSMAVKAAAASTTTKAKATSTSKKTATKTPKVKASKADAKPKKAAAPPKPNKTSAIDLPKRPSTSWGLFFLEHLEKVRASGKPVVPTAETVVASVAWKSLPAAEKQVYQDRYKASRVAYEKQISSRLQELTPAEFKLENARRQALRALGKTSVTNLKDPNAPKRPLSSYFLFAQEQRASGKFSDLSIQEQARAMAQAWKDVSEQERTRYVDQAKINIDAYKAKKAAYEAKHQ